MLDATSVEHDAGNVAVNGFLLDMPLLFEQFVTGALREATGHLVYARGNEDPARHVVRQSGIEIFCHAVDLSLAPDELIGRMRDLAAAIAAASR